MDNKNIKTLQELSKNVNMALKSIEHLNKEVKDKNFESELTNQYKTYQDINKRICDVLIENAVESKDLNMFEKAMLYSSIKLNTLADSSTSHFADMLIKGTVMGVNDLTKLLHECENEKDCDKKNKCCCDSKDEGCDKTTLKILDELLKTEEEFITNLKKFL